MCTVSNVGDGWARRSKKVYPWVYPPTTPYDPNPSSVSKEEFDKLKKEVEGLKELLKAAKKFDEETGQPDCEMDEKVELIKKVAELVGVDMKEVFSK